MKRKKKTRSRGRNKKHVGVIVLVGGKGVVVVVDVALWLGPTATQHRCGRNSEKKSCRCFHYCRYYYCCRCCFCCSREISPRHQSMCRHLTVISASKNVNYSSDKFFSFSLSSLCRFFVSVVNSYGTQIEITQSAMFSRAYKLTKHNSNRFWTWENRFRFSTKIPYHTRIRIGSDKTGPSVGP